MATAVLYPSTTPSDYHRVLSPALNDLKSKVESVPVGLLACQRDPLLKQIETQVVSVEACKSIPTSKKVSKSKSASSTSVPSGNLLEVVLHDTVIFPEGGGQPSDIGKITTVSTAYDVIRAERHGGTAVHYVSIPSLEEHDIAPGVNVTVSLGKEGWDRRYDHMSMHTSQHLLSAMLEVSPDIGMYVNTTAWSLTTWPTPCYVDLSRAVDANEAAKVQSEANRLVFEGRRIHVEVETMAEKTEVEDNKISKGVPTDYTGGVNRVVVIDDLDRNPCCGTHLPSLHNLQLFVIPPLSPSTRLHFLSGPRLIHHLTNVHNQLTAASLTLSCGLPAVPERVNQIVDERRKAVKRNDETEKELSESVAASLVSEVHEGPFIKALHRTDDSPNILMFLGSIATVFARSVPETTQYLVVISSSPASQSSLSTTSILVVGSHADSIKSFAEKMKSQFGNAIKGGGKGRWTGKFTGVWGKKQEAVVQESLGEITIE